ncbi:MAG: tetratricopeptide repeat protein [Bacteroidales bacterium]
MMIKNIFYRLVIMFTLVLFPLGNNIYSQTSNDKLTARLEYARGLYNRAMYLSAEKEFNELGEVILNKQSLEKSEMEAYKVLCAIALRRPNISGMVKNFEKDYPNALELTMIKFELGKYYFDKEDYKNSLMVFESISTKNLYIDNRLEFVFKMAYCNMRVGNYDKAATGFKNVINAEFSQYTYPGIYHLAYVYYLSKNFEEAFPLFEKAANDSRFNVLASYYAVESKFMLSDYDYVIDKGPDIFDKQDKDIQTSLARIISEAYFVKNIPSLAKKYFDIYSGSVTKLSRKDHYYSGVIAYSLQSYLSAIESFEAALSKNDSLGQSAYYFTANSYLKTKNKLAALSAFKAASECDFDLDVKEDALFNYAKLSFDVNSDISQFQKYLIDYSRSGKEDIINSYMATAFLLRKDYKSAVDALTKIKNPTQETSENLQKAAFFRAMQLIENGGYRAAMPLLDISIKNGLYNIMLNNLALYWQAECYYRNEKYSEAIKINQSLVSSKEFSYANEYPLVIYNLAYSYFKNKNFIQAKNWFTRYLDISHSNKSYDKDAQVRLADSYFMQNEYKESAKIYEGVYNKYPRSSDIYSAYQSAISYGLVGDDNKKIDILKKVIKGNEAAQLYSQSLFELGRTYVQRGDDESASDCFYTLLRSKRDSTFYSKSLLELAMIETNNGKYDRALAYYKNIVEDAPLSPEVQDAITGMESIYQTLNKPEDFLAYLDELGLSGIKSTGEKELMLFNAAEHIFLSGNYPAAMNSLQSFIASYPNGTKTAQAYFYLAEALKATSRFEAALDAYLQVMKIGDGAFAESATLNYANISFEMEHYSKAIEAYETLSYIAKTDKNKYLALVGKMRSFFGNKQYDKAIKEAQRVGNITGAADSLLREADFIKAKSYFKLGDRDLAKPIFEKLAKNCDDEIGSESAYLIISDAYDAGDFISVENKVYALSDTGTSQLYWLAKSFIILGDSFADREEWEQARATFESIKNGYKPTKDNDDVLDQVRMRLNKLKANGK